MSAAAAHDAWMQATRDMELAAVQLAESISVQAYVDTDPTYPAQRGPVADAKRAEDRARYLARYRAAVLAADNAHATAFDKTLRRSADVDERLRQMDA